jgi:hypothetical protein
MLRSKKCAAISLWSQKHVHRVAIKYGAQQKSPFGHRFVRNVLYTPAALPLNRQFNPSALSERAMLGTIARLGHNILLAALALITVVICLQFG